MKQQISRSTKSSKQRKAERDNSSVNKKMLESRKGKLERKLLNYDDLPEYLKDNEFIRNYYRCEWSLKDTALSIFSLHNETLNIWTHLVGFLVFVALTAMSLTSETTVETLFRPAATWPPLTIMNKSNGSDNLFPDSYFRHVVESSMLNGGSDVIPLWPWFVFLGGAMGCLICSSISHLFACHSRLFSLFFWRLDYAGISLMIVCSFFAPVYYAFSCNPYWRLSYLTSITIFGILAIITLLSPTLSNGKYRSFRAKLFLAMGFSGVIPAAHAVLLYYDHQQVLVALGYEIAMGLLYAVGAGFYVSRIPERWNPGTFDIVGHSHQIFHVFVVAAALAHSAASIVIMDWRRGSPVC